MQAAIDKINDTPLAGIVSIILVWFGLAVGHSFVVLQSQTTGGFSVVDSMISLAIGIAGFVLLWVGMKQPETQGTILGYVAGTLIWCGPFEWTWRYTAHFLDLEPVMDDGMVILSGELLMIQATTLIVVCMLLFLGANKDTRCRMFMWFHRNFKMRPDKMTAGYKRQYARIAAMETVFLIWGIYLFAIWINDPRGIHYASPTAMAITAGFVIWGFYLINKNLKIRGIAPAFRYAIPTAHIMWLPIEAFSRWGLYPEVWIKPQEYTVLMSIVLVMFVTGLIAIYGQNRQAGAVAA
jgi:hypothetical protein